MALLNLNIPDATLQAMKELADITGIPEGKDQLAQLIEDAIRTHEWLIYQQLNKKYIVVLERPEMDLLVKSATIHGEREVVESLIAPDMAPKAIEYFQKAA